MMRIYIIVLNITLLCIGNALWAQLPDSVAGPLVQWEYQYWKTNSKKEHTALAVQRIQWMIQHGLDTTTACYEEMSRIYVDQITSTELKQTMSWNMALVSTIHDDYDLAWSHLQRYYSMTSDTSNPVRLLSILLSSKLTLDSTETIGFVHPWPELEQCLLKENQGIDSSYKKYTTWSFVLPGAAMVAKGYTGKGITSFLLNIGSGIGVYALARAGLYGNAIGYAVLTVFKFYPGNLRLTRKLVPKKYLSVRNKKQRDCYEQMERLLQKYPIGYK